MNNISIYLKYLDFENTSINGSNQKIPTVNVTPNIENANIIKDIYKSLIKSYSSKDCISDNKEEIVDIYKEKLVNLDKEVNVMKRVMSS